MTIPCVDSPSLIPGLPDEVAELCLLRLPFPHHSAVRSVSSSWNRAISDPAFAVSKKTLDLSHPYLFVLAFDPSSSSSCPSLLYQAFNPRSSLWLSLPPPPSSDLSPASSASASLPQQGALFVLGGVRTDGSSAVSTILRYSASSNSWSPASPMPTRRSFFSATTVAGKVLVVGDDAVGGVDAYDPVSDRWSLLSELRLSPYDVAVIDRKLYVTEGWSWPFDCVPKGGVYDAERDSWEEMKVGMREGWTGAAVVSDGRLLVVSEHRGTKVKAYVEERDEWEYLSGGGVPWEVRRPLAVASGEDGRIYVVGNGLSVAVGTLSKEKSGGFRLEWEVVEGPPQFKGLVPTAAHVLYA